MSERLPRQAYIYKAVARAGERDHDGLDTADHLLWLLLLRSCIPACL